MTLPKSCVVPKCKNTNLTKPQKMFAILPVNLEMRKKWLEAAGADVNLSQKTHYMCQDHFDLANDMSNYTQYCINGSVLRLQIKFGNIPSKFDCQTDNNMNSTIKTVSCASTQTDPVPEIDPLADTEQNCGSSTFDTDAIKLEKIDTGEEEEYTYFVVV